MCLYLTSLSLVLIVTVELYENLLTESLVLRRGEEFEVTPASSELLFYPASRVVTISGMTTTA